VDGYGHITALTAVDLDQRYLPKAGGTLTGGLTLNADPTTNLGAATKQYVDTKATTQYVDTKYAFTYGNTIYAAGYTNSYNWDNNYNYIDIYPPSGYTTLVAFIPSIAVIHFAGRVDGNDSIRCTWANYGTYIRVWVQNTEQRDVPAANWLAIWSA
jgi:hypothetical protein